MRKKHIARTSLSHLLRRVLWCAVLAIVVAICAIVAIYQFTAAGFLALEAQYGALEAKLFIGALYIGLGLVAGAGYWALRNIGTGVDKPSTPASQRKLKGVMLAEAVMLGFALARKATRAS
jgi:hypothetical protein